LHQGWVNAVAISADSRYFATASEDATACVWALSGGKMHCIDQHLARVKALAFSSDSRYLATASSDETARIWALDTNDGKAYHEVSRIKHDDCVNDVAFSPDGKKIATAASDHTAWVTIWQDLDKEVCSRLTIDENLIKKAKHYLPDESFLSKVIGKAAEWLTLQKPEPACTSVQKNNQ
jgi:WD40 repeat protein